MLIVNAIEIKRCEQPSEKPSKEFEHGLQSQKMVLACDAEFGRAEFECGPNDAVRTRLCV